MIDNGAGGSGVGPFRATLTVARPFTADVQRSATAAMVTWRGGDPAGYVIIDDSSASIGRVSAGFVCTERVSAGRFSMPSVVLQSLPPNPADPSGPSISASHSPRNRFQATGLDVGQFSFFHEKPRLDAADGAERVGKWFTPFTPRNFASQPYFLLNQ